MYQNAVILENLDDGFFFFFFKIVLFIFKMFNHKWGKD